MWFAYIDESKHNNRHFVYSALIVDTDEWNKVFDSTKKFRLGLKKSHGIYVQKELHASEFAAGKGQIAPELINKAARAKIFEEVMKFIADPSLFKIMSSINTDEFYAFERLINRINKTAETNKKQVLLICDEGQETEFTKRIRKMRVYNPIPSNRGTWEDGASAKNITTDWIIEDPVFKDSRSSYFIQLVDFCAYSLLRSEVPVASKTALGYDKMYDLLKPITLPINNRGDPRKLGIIR
jgi:type III secretion system FlhB-like substrate exporter